MRNFWLSAHCAGRKTSIGTGPASKDGSMEISLHMKVAGKSVEYLTVICEGGEEPEIRLHVGPSEVDGKHVTSMSLTSAYGRQIIAHYRVYIRDGEGVSLAYVTERGDAICGSIFELLLPQEHLQLELMDDKAIEDVLKGSPCQSSTHPTLKDAVNEVREYWGLSSLPRLPEIELSKGLSEDIRNFEVTEALLIAKEVS